MEANPTVGLRQVDGLVSPASRSPADFLVDPNKNLFCCDARGRGGDVIRIAELYHGVRFAKAMALQRRGRGPTSLLPDVVTFYQIQLHRHAGAGAYLLQPGVHRAELIEKLCIGYAPGRCLRAWLTSWDIHWNLSGKRAW